jgi:RNA polymerase sigma factor (sigma-70 family)
MFSFTKKELAHIETRALHYAFKLKRSSFFQEEVCDLQQDLILQILESWKNFNKNRGSFEAFAEEILKNKYRNMIRDQLRLKRQGLLINFEEVAEEISASNGPENIEEIHQKIDVEKYLKKSPIFLQQVMAEIQNNSIRNVAKKLGFPRSRLRGLVKSCRRTLAPLAEFVNGADFLGIRRLSCLSH